MMPRLAADLSVLFQELPFAARFAAAQAAGFAGVSLASPYDGPVQDLRDRLVLAGLSFVAMQGPPPNYTGTPQGFAATTGGEDRFQRDFKRMMRYAEVLKPAAIELRSGTGGDGETLGRNLAFACAEAPKHVFTLAPSPEGGVLSSYAEAAALVEAVGAPNLGLVLDSGMAVRLGTDAVAVWQAHGPLVRHISLSIEPGSDGVKLPGFLAHLDSEAYAGWVSADFTPRLSTLESLGWMPPAAPAPTRKRKK